MQFFFFEELIENDKSLKDGLGKVSVLIAQSFSISCKDKFVIILFFHSNFSICFSLKFTIYSCGQILFLFSMHFVVALHLKNNLI